MRPRSISGYVLELNLLHVHVPSTYQQYVTRLMKLEDGPECDSHKIPQRDLVSVLLSTRKLFNMRCPTSHARASIGDKLSSIIESSDRNSSPGELPIK